MRIVHVVRGLANSSGTTHIVGQLAEAQGRRGHSVKLLFVEKPGETAVIPDPSLVESRELPMTVPSIHFGWSLPFARAVRQATRTADVVHIHAIWNYPTWRAMRESLRAGVPYVVAPQGSLEEWALRRSRRSKQLYALLAEKRYFDRAAAIQAVTREEAEQCRRFGIRAPAAILPNGVDLVAVDRRDRVADLEASLSLPPGALTFLFLGRLFPKKGLDLLIPAFAALAATNADAFLLIAGHDAGSGYRAELERLVVENGMQRRVRFLGEVSGKEKFELLRATDVFVLSSHSEGLPVAVLEAMACSRPVVVTPGCHLPEVSECEAGWSVCATVASLAAGLRAAGHDPDERRRRGRNARALVEESFSSERVADRSTLIYERLITGVKDPAMAGATG